MCGGDERDSFPGRRISGKLSRIGSSSRSLGNLFDSLDWKLERSQVGRRADTYHCAVEWLEYFSRTTSGGGTWTQRRRASSTSRPLSLSLSLSLKVRSTRWTTQAIDPPILTFSSPFLFSLLSNPRTSQEYKIAERERERERGRVSEAKPDTGRGRV